MRYGVVALSIAAAFALVSAPEPCAGATWTRVAVGVEHRRATYSLPGRALKVNVVKVNLTKAFIEPVMADPDGSGIVPLSTPKGNLMYSPVPKTVKAIVDEAGNKRRRGKGAVAAINGGFFFHQKHGPTVRSSWNLAYALTSDGKKFYPWNHQDHFDERKKEAERALMVGRRIASTPIVRKVRDVRHRKMLAFGFKRTPAGATVQYVRIEDHDLARVRPGETALGVGGPIWPPIRTPS